MDSLTLTFALIGVLGVGSQWLAVRLHMPAIVFMLAAGVLAGPVFGLLDPKDDFGDLFKPIVAVAVALILFEGGLTLNFRDLRDAAPAVRRLCTIGAILGWIGNTAAAHWIAGLSWPVAAVFGGILVVTGPTVIIPLLRQARLSSRTASTLRWEAIVNDPAGALLAVLAFEAVVASQGDHLVEAAGYFAGGLAAATAAGWIAGRGLTIGFRRGLVPEYMKAPILFAAVLAVYAGTDWILHESGLLAVTVMGMTMANAQLPSLDELKRFKEHVTVLLVSGVFVILAATLKPDDLLLLDAWGIAFIVVIMVVARPAAVFLSLIGTNLTMPERGFVAWVAPRGVVAVAVSGFFGERLVDLGYADAAMLAPLAFALVAITVIVHGFSIRPLARAMGLTSTHPPGVILLGGGTWTAALAGQLRQAEVPVLVVDRNWHRLGKARAAGLPVWFGELLSEAADHALDLHHYDTLLAATDNDSYNALVCTDVGAEMGRDRVFQVGRHENGDDHARLPIGLGGRALMASAPPLGLLDLRMARGWVLSTVDVDADAPDLHEKAEPVALIRQGRTLFFSPASPPQPRKGDRLIVFTPAPADAVPGDDAVPDADAVPSADAAPDGDPAA